MRYLKIDPDSADRIVFESLQESLRNHVELEGDVNDPLIVALHIVSAFYSIPGEYMDGKYDDYI